SDTAASWPNSWPRSRGMTSWSRSSRRGSPSWQRSNSPIRPRSRGNVLATNGQPSSAVLLLLDQLLESGAALRYHGDFDTPGLAICERLTHRGVIPWRMTARDYCDALS